ncbi:MAG: DNA repair exonuclease [Thermaerobacter sp.]|nr:DNA repair exonuclease [Thermaerobacter sp.]
MRFVHTGDWQMGLRAVQAQDRARQVRQARFDTARSIAAVARRERADFVLLAGDTFEDHDVDEADVERTVEVLNRFAPIQVYVLPGNHDPLVPGGVWGRASWRRVGGHVHLLERPEPLELPGGAVLYPCPLRQKQSRMDPTDWIPAREAGDSRIRLGLAHGSLRVLPQAENFPIARDRAETAGLDYLALGDWHSYRVFGRTVYCGTPEQTAFDERDAGNVAVVELTDAGSMPQVRREAVEQLRWEAFECRVEDPSDVQRLAEQLAAAGDPARLLARVSCRVAATAPPEALEHLEGLRTRWGGEALLLRWEAEAPPRRLQSEELPEGIFRQAAEDLAALAAGQTPQGPAAAMRDRDPAVLEAARQLLSRLAEEVAR